MAKRCIKGETLVETLAAILIASLSTMMLLTATITASKINRSAASSDESFLQQQYTAEQQGTDENRSSVTIKSAGNSQVYGTYDVDHYGKDGKLQSYVLIQPEGGTAP